MSLPPLTVKLPSSGVQMLSKVFGGVRKTADQIEPYTDWWNAQNSQAIANASANGGPVVAVIGDSMAIGIGATAPDKGYLGLVRDQLVASDGRPWQMINLGQWGDKLQDGIDRQIPALATIAKPDILIVCLGSNDMVWGVSPRKLRKGLKHMVEALPAPARFCTLIGASPRATIANKALLRLATDGGHEVVDPWFRWKGNQASDRFHPNDDGYVLMAKAFCKSLGLDYVPQPTPDQPQNALTTG